MRNAKIQAALIRPGGLCELLVKVRLDAGFNGKGIAEAIKWDPAKVSRTESGVRIPTRDELERWIEVCAVVGDEAAKLREEIEWVLVEYPRSEHARQLTEKRTAAEYATLDSDTPPRTLIEAYQQGYADALRDVQARIGQLAIPRRSDLESTGFGGSE